MIRRVFHACAGPGDLIAAHAHWHARDHMPTEVSITFSEQIEQFCEDVGAALCMVSTNPDGRRQEQGTTVIEHRPKRDARGLRYHLEEVRYGLGLLRTARRFGTDVAILDSGATQFWVMAAFRLVGIRVVLVMHNTLWPHGFKPARRRDRLLAAIDRLLFWRAVPSAVIGVSPEACRQVEAVAPAGAYPIVEIRAQFRRPYFAQIGAAPDHGLEPFQMMFIGRVDRIKGVLDIPEMAREVEARQSGRVRWVICGRGRDLEALRARIAELGVGHIVEARGWTSLEDLVGVYDRSHAAVVPTRSSFAEGLAMTAAEAILAGRPVVTNPVVPALELLAPASLAGRTNDPLSHAEQVYRLATDRALYERLAAACPALGEPFYDRTLGLTATLHRLLGGIAAARES